MRKCSLVLLLVGSMWMGCVSTANNVKPTEGAQLVPDAGPVDAGPPAPPPDPRAQIAPLRETARSLLKLQSELYWKNWTTGDPIDVAGTYVGHEALFSKESIALVSAAEAAETEPERKRADDYFKLYLASEYIARQVATLEDQIANLRGLSTFKVGDKELPYYALEVLQAKEDNHPRRLELAHAALPVLAQLNPLLQKKEELTQKLVSELGYSGYNEFASQLRNVDLESLAATADQLLTQTETIYTGALAAAVHRELNLELNQMRRADIPRFFYDANVRSAFPAEQMMPRLKALLSGMGIDFDSLKSITLDDKPAERKNPRGVCFAIEVPTDVRLSIKPQGGVDDYLQLYHESGHALSHAFTTTPVWEFQQLGSYAVTEAYAFLFEDLLEDPRYLAELGLSGELLQHYVHSAAVKKLYMLRRYAAKVIFERAWHAGDADPAARYAEVFSRASGFPVTAEDAQQFMVDHDNFFYSADYLRAWFLAAQIDEALASKFGETWWHDPKAGELLKSLWSHGNSQSADEVAKAIGASGLDPAPLLRRVQARLGPSK